MSGYFQEEPLVPSRAPHGKFVVVEGNRRLGAPPLTPLAGKPCQS